MGKVFRFKFGSVALFVQVVFIVLFATLLEYDDSADPKLPMVGDHNYVPPTSENATSDGETTWARVSRKYPPFQDVHVMIFIGFGFLMTFLCRYGYSAVGLNFFMASLIVQWAMIVRGFVYQGTFTGKKYKIVVDEMVTADFASATVLISFGAVLGKTTPLQLLIMGLIEVILAQINGMVCHDKLHAVDVGESMYIHAFGAYFGLAVSRMLYSEKAQKSQKSESVYHSDLFSMIGTVFLWMYWPSFNGGGAEGDEQHRAYINTYLSLAACTVVTFAMSAIYDKKGKFTMEFVQNATLAGGVAVGTTANMPLQPYGALIMGSVAGLISVTGYKYISGFLTDKLRIQDTCGVNNLHGMPAILAAIAGAVMAAMSSEDKWGRSMYEIFPYTVPATGADFDALVQRYPDLEPGKGWSSGKQGGYQMLALVITLGIAIVGGILTGLLLKLPVFDQDQLGEVDDLYEDAVLWNLPEEEEHEHAKKYIEDKNGSQMSEMPRVTEEKGSVHL
ncbi:ammonium transporter Rh type B-like isoform X1 [Mya arenaria]|uniref:ammonium transporter Rh type B-like isoform X1 n=1 Tax=Mya arenaria TaxID=6604 RepID=UPI0022E8D1AF|nr:ammonium transporter Rh type B-like isoform X1 [Mya arenaria]